MDKGNVAICGSFEEIKETTLYKKFKEMEE
jgi:hypothetical protein